MTLIRINKQPGNRQLAVFAAGWFVFVGLAGLACLRHAEPRAACALWAFAVAVPASGVISRTPIRMAYIGLSFSTFPIGVVVSYAALAVAYFLVITPVGIAMRLMGNDPLCRRLDRGASSYWKQREQPKNVESYFDQQ